MEFFRSVRALSNPGHGIVRTTISLSGTLSAISCHLDHLSGFIVDSFWDSFCDFVPSGSSFWIRCGLFQDFWALSNPGHGIVRTTISLSGTLSAISCHLDNRSWAYAHMLGCTEVTAFVFTTCKLPGLIARYNGEGIGPYGADIVRLEMRFLWIRDEYPSLIGPGQCDRVGRASFLSCVFLANGTRQTWCLFVVLL